MDTIYDSAWHHPGMCWLASAALALCFAWVVPRPLHVFTAWWLVEIVLDAAFTGALAPFPSQALAIAFVILGDLRYFQLMERSLWRALPIAFVVPVLQTLLMRVLAPPWFGDPRSIFLAYELIFIAFATLLWLRYPHQDAFRRGLFFFELAQYLLWAGIDIILISGHPSVLPVRILPNAFYYAGFLWFVVLYWRRHSPHSPTPA